MTTPPVDVYVAPIDTPPVDTVTDPSGHLLVLPDSYRWAGVLWRPEPGEGTAVVRTGFNVWLTVDPLLPDSFGYATGDLDWQNTPTAHWRFRVLTVTRVEDTHLVWQVQWLPRAAFAPAAARPGLLGIRGDRDPTVGNRGTLAREFWAGPGFAAKLGRTFAALGSWTE